jgi:hypothetical protein
MISTVIGYNFESRHPCWTNLQLKQITPLELGIKYFEMFPEDKEPVWQVGPMSSK